MQRRYRAHIRVDKEAIARSIADGHAFEKHVKEFAEVTTRGQFAELISRIITNPSEIKYLRNGRTAYWADAHQTIVILNPNVPEGGTAFKPIAGKQYFDELV